MSTLLNTRSDGTAAIPSAYKIDECTLTNKDGVAIDLQPYVQEIKIIESLYSPTLFCSVIVRDDLNLLEILPIYGLETIYIRLSRKQGDDGVTQNFERLFYVTEYPIFERADRQRVQGWKLSAISYHAFKDNMMRISRYYPSGSPISHIVKIAKDAFGMTLITQGDTTQRGRGVINTQTPLQAIEWFRRRLYGANGEPFYFYETLKSLDKQAFLTCHNQIITGNVFDTYVSSRDFNTQNETPENYAALRGRMLNVSSTLKLGKFDPMLDGSFGANGMYVDIANRSFKKITYNYTSQFPLSSTIYNTSILKTPPPFNPTIPEDVRAGSGEPTIKINEEKLDEQFYSKIDHISLNSQSYSGAVQNYNMWSHEKLLQLNAYPGIFDTLSHDVTVYGNFELNAGKVVQLNFPRTADPAIIGKGELYDKVMSGKYIVVSVAHKFAGPEYTCDFRAKRDSFTK